MDFIREYFLWFLLLTRETITSSAEQFGTYAVQNARICSGDDSNIELNIRGCEQYRVTFIVTADYGRRNIRRNGGCRNQEQCRESLINNADHLFYQILVTKCTRQSECLLDVNFDTLQALECSTQLPNFLDVSFICPYESTLFSICGNTNHQIPVKRYQGIILNEEYPKPMAASDAQYTCTCELSTSSGNIDLDIIEMDLIKDRVCKHQLQIELSNGDDQESRTYDCEQYRTKERISVDLQYNTIIITFRSDENTKGGRFAIAFRSEYSHNVQRNCYKHIIAKPATTTIIPFQPTTLSTGTNKPPGANTAGSDAAIGGAVSAVVIAVVLIFIAAGIIIHRKRKAQKNEESNKQTEDDPTYHDFETSGQIPTSPPTIQNNPPTSQNKLAPDNQYTTLNSPGGAYEHTYSSLNTGNDYTTLDDPTFENAIYSEAEPRSSDITDGYASLEIPNAENKEWKDMENEPTYFELENSGKRSTKKS